MKVTDLFAAAAMLGMIMRNEKRPDKEGTDAEWITHMAYHYAEQMLTSKIDYEEEWRFQFEMGQREKDKE
jgi:hypothetical protein